MTLTRPIEVRSGVVGGGKEPLICAPLVGADEAAVGRELAAVLARGPDLVEWRVDFFAGIADPARVVALGREIRAQAAGTPVIFTRRSSREGGQPIPLSEDEVLALYGAVARAGCVDLIDYELGCEARHFQGAVALARETGTRLIASFHDFQQTPAAGDIVAKFVAMEKAGADIAKVAVMPREMRDVLTLLEATLEGQQAISLPIITMSMGAYGSLSRLFGWAFGSSVTFAVGEKSSAPGQIPIEQLKTVLDILRGTLG